MYGRSVSNSCTGTRDWKSRWLLMVSKPCSRPKRVPRLARTSFASTDCCASSGRWARRSRLCQCRSREYSIPARRNALCTGRLTFERRAHQPKKRLRIVAFLQAEILDLAILRQEPRPEHQVPHDDRVAVVGVRFPRHARVMPAVRFGAADDVIERAVANVDVAVLEEAVGRVGDVVEREDLLVHTQQQERQAVERHLQRDRKSVV